MYHTFRQIDKERKSEEGTAYAKAWRYDRAERIQGKRHPSGVKAHTNVQGGAATNQKLKSCEEH